MQLNEWWNFFSLCATASVTLMGLTFIAVTLGQSLIKKETLSLANIFFSPSCFHFLHIFFLCIMTAVPGVNPLLMGLSCIISALWRLVKLPNAYRLLREQSKKNNEIELSDWCMIIYIPALIYLVLIVVGYGFLQGRPWAVEWLAASCLFLLMASVKGTWDMLLWTASSLR